MTRDPRIFRPEEEIQRQINAVNAGFINPDGTRADGDQGAPIGGGIGFKFTMVLLPFITVFLAAVVWIGGIAGCAPSLRALLTAALPQSWVATSAGAPNNPAGVGAVLAIVLLFAAVGLLVARRLVVRRWVSAGGLHAFGAALGV
ncbi:MAG TPA: hypothetical protein VK024_08020, partial [Actinomycetaceae bacterium]|nr:hypothetical protein [Actinomycetaceae bacterium]